MNDIHALQVTPQQLEEFARQPDFLEACYDFIETNGIDEDAYSPVSPAGRMIVLEDFDLSLLMTSVNPPFGDFSQAELLFSHALVYGEHHIGGEHMLSYNSPADVAIIASELESFPLSDLQAYYEENAEHFRMVVSPVCDNDEKRMSYQATLFKWVTEFYQSARMHEYAVLIFWM